MVSYRVEVLPSAAEAIRRLPSKKIQRQVVSRIDRLGTDPRPSKYKVLEGNSGLCRVRAGDYRIIYKIEDGRLLVTVVRVGDRKHIYRGI